MSILFSKSTVILLQLIAREPFKGFIYLVQMRTIPLHATTSKPSNGGCARPPAHTNF